MNISVAFSNSSFFFNQYLYQIPKYFNHLKRNPILVKAVLLYSIFFPPFGYHQNASFSMDISYKWNFTTYNLLYLTSFIQYISDVHTRCNTALLYPISAGLLNILFSLPEMFWLFPQLLKYFVFMNSSLTTPSR